ncbi:MAG TPA: hypothetical protein VG710_04005 [Opitutus sp.]|nr:hypothetical protein [Opitutus sp.]
MNDRDQRRYDRLVRVQTFGKTNTGDFAAGGLAATQFAALDATVAQIDAAKAQQTPARVSKSTLLDALLLDLRALVRTARAIDATSPGFSAGFVPPDHPTEASIRTQADAFLARLEDQAGDTDAQKTAKAAMRAKFAAYEMSATFVADLRADRDALQQAGESNVVETQDGVASTAQLGVLLTEGTAIVQQLDAAVRNRYARQADKLAAWHSASHVERSAVRAKANTDIGAAAPATAPAAS